MFVGIFGIIVSLILLITLAYRGVPVILAAPIASAVALIFSGAPILASYTEIFMPAMADFVSNYFPVFLVGAIFGVLMTVTGYAESIARTVTGWVGTRSAIAATVITSALMTYGGISLFVVAFVMYPLARELFRAADIPRRLVPGTIALGIFTFTMTSLPGTPQVQNIIPGQFFGTSTYAAPGIGLAGGGLILALGLTWLEYRRSSLIKKGEHFDSRESAPQIGGSADDGSSHNVDTLVPTNRVTPFVPLLTVFAVNFSLTLVIFPAMNWGYLEEDQFGNISLDERSGLWAVLVAILVAIVVIVGLNFKNIRELRIGFTDGVKRSMLPIFSTASEVGYGAVVASVAAFAVIRDSVFNMGADALWTSVVSTSITAGLTGSSSGGMTIALNAFGDELRDMAVADGTSLEAMHRLTAMAAGGLDTLPHSGAVVTLLIVCGLTHRQGYKDIGMVTLVIPVLVVASLVTLVSIFGTA